MKATKHLKAKEALRARAIDRQVILVDDDIARGQRDLAGGAIRCYRRSGPLNVRTTQFTLDLTEHQGIAILTAAQALARIA